MKKYLLFCMVALVAMACNAQSKPGLVKVTDGMIQGIVEKDMMIFKGIPFAAPPVGELRWKAPQPVIPWEGVRDADKFGPSPIAGMGMQRVASEDCLYLNVWTPAKSPKEKLPVMVWIYGGGFSMGTSSFYDGAPIAREGVVLVTINYRVGKLGFFAHPALSAENPRHVSGNYGILDQIAALRWVKDNIAAFGGDPSKVTIFGESAGGISVSMLCASPLAKGLFRAAISQSGSSFGPIRQKSYPGENMKSLAQSEKEGAEFGESKGATTAAALRALKPEELSRQMVVTGGAWPIVDGYVIPDDQYKMYENGNYNDVALLIGYNSDEGDSFGFTEDPTQHIASVRERYEDFADKLLAVYPLENGKVGKTARDLGRDAAFGWGTWSWGRLQNKTGKQPVYMYYFDQDPTYSQGDRRYGHRSPHGQDVDFVFQSVRPGNNPTDQTLAKYILKYWTNFAKYCDPNGQGNKGKASSRSSKSKANSKKDDAQLPVWPLFKNENSQVMVLTGEGPHPAPVASEKAMWVLDEYFAWRRSQEGQTADQENAISKLMVMLNDMTDEQKAYARANWLMAPKAYTQKHDHPSSYIISPNPVPDTQTGNECAACSSAYLLRFYGENIDGVSLYQQPSFPCKYDEGAYPKCFKILFEKQYKNYTAEYYTGTTEDLKDAISQGIPVITLLFKGKTLHYVPVVGYDETHFFIQDSVEKYRNITDNKAYNESVDIDTFDKSWNIPIESCQRLFVVVKKR